MKTVFILLGFLLALFSQEVPLVQADYSDVEGYEFRTAIEFLTEEGIVMGYEDNTVRPEQSISRAEFLKVMTLASDLTVEELTACFTDVEDEWFASYVCSAKGAGWVNGYPDGSFGPDATVNLVEALKIVSEAFELELITPTGDSWYSPYLETLAELGAIPYTLDYYSETLTRGEAFELLWRIMEEKTEESASQLEDFKGDSCTDFLAESPSNIDLDRVRDTWFSWTNAARATQGLSAYTHNEALDYTATVWSEYSRDRGYMDHKRPGTTAYYDYYAILDWFADLGVSFTSVSGTTYTENIGRGPYSCSEEDCTDELLSAIRYTFDYYMSEAGSDYRPHYNSIMNTAFTQIGFGMALSDSSYYMTVHYATALETAQPFCD